MHLSDGVLNLPAVVATSVAAAGVLAYSMKGLKENEIPKISLMTATFFTFSMLTIPVGPSSVHPLLGGLLGIMLGWRSPLAIFVGLLLQALIFQHGGLTTLGVNTLLVSLPAVACYKFFYLANKKFNSPFVSGGIMGAFGVIGCVLLLVIVLYFTDSRYSEGFFSVINILIIGYLPLVVIEAFITAFAMSFIYRIKPNLLNIPLYKDY